jgi:hypothetical protein
MLCCKGGIFLRLASLCKRRIPKSVPTCLPTDGVLVEALASMQWLPETDDRYRPKPAIRREPGLIGNY